jgi:transcriptional regulator with XRE-family HTH domain
MNSNKISEIRKLVELSRRNGSRPHYSGEIQALAKGLLKNGVSRTELANETGISRGTLVNWSEKSRQPRFRKVRTVANDASLKTQIKISLPSGVQIECADASILKNILDQCA